MKCILVRKIQKKSQQIANEAKVITKSLSTISNDTLSFTSNVMSSVLEKHPNLKSELEFIQNSIQNKQTEKYKDIISSIKDFLKSN